MVDTVLDILDTGSIAGDVLTYLEDHQGSSTTFQIKMALYISNAQLYLALGWLKREDKILLEKLDKGYNIIRK